MKRFQYLFPMMLSTLMLACGNDEALVDPDSKKLGLNDACSSDLDCRRGAGKKRLLECVDYAVYYYDRKKDLCLLEPTQKMYNTCQKRVLREYKTKEGCEQVHMQKEVKGWKELRQEAGVLESNLNLREEMTRFVEEIIDSEIQHFKKHEYYVAAKSYPPFKAGTEAQPWVVEESGGFWKMNLIPLPGRAGNTPKKVRLPEQLSDFSIIGSYSVTLIDKGFVVEVASDLDSDGERAVYRYNSVTGAKKWASLSEL